MSEPISRFRLRSRLTWVAAAPVLALAVWYALDPPATPALTAQTRAELDPAPPEASTPGSLDVAAFDAPVWVAPPRPEPSVAERAPEVVPAQQIRLQLIGIVSEPDPTTGKPVHLAAVFDPDSFEMYVVKSGDKVGGFSVEAVKANGVRLVDGPREARLELEDWRIPGGAS